MAPERRDPGVELAERLRDEPVDAPLRVDLCGHEPSVAKHLQVLRHRRLREPQLRDEIADGSILVPEQLQDPTPIRLGHDLEGRQHSLYMNHPAYACQGIYSPVVLVRVALVHEDAATRVREPARTGGAAPWRLLCSAGVVMSELWSLLGMLSLQLAHVMCPSCPTQQAARDAFWSDGAALRIGGMIGPFVVTAGLVALVVSRLGARAAGRANANAELAPEEKS